MVSHKDGIIKILGLHHRGRPARDEMIGKLRKQTAFIFLRRPEMSEMSAKAQKHYKEVISKLYSSRNVVIGHEYSNGLLTEEYETLWKKLEYPPTMFPQIKSRLVNMTNPTEDAIYKKTQKDGFINTKDF
jgi:predicted choloylglycine hydrolase